MNFATVLRVDSMRRTEDTQHKRNTIRFEIGVPCIVFGCTPAQRTATSINCFWIFPIGLFCVNQLNYCELPTQHMILSAAVFFLCVATTSTHIPSESALETCVNQPFHFSYDPQIQITLSIHYQYCTVLQYILYSTMWSIPLDYVTTLQDGGPFEKWMCDIMIY